MAWEQRGNNSYYYRKKRQGTRVVTQYVGNDFSANLLAELDREERAEHLHDQAKWRKQISECREIEVEIEHLANVMHLLVRATLLISGYHPYKGQWRKKRYG
jgi:hypothetical protein